MHVGETVNWMGLKATVTRIESEDHFFVQIGPEANRYEVEVNLKHRPSLSSDQNPLPGWENV